MHPAPALRIGFYPELRGKPGTFPRARRERLDDPGIGDRIDKLTIDIGALLGKLPVQNTAFWR